MSVDDYRAVPDVAPDAELDPYWRSDLDDWSLPTSYLPPAMGGSHLGWARLAAWLLIAVFLTATTGGICLTYGPGR